MKTSHPAALAAALTCAALPGGASAQTGAHVECWAPHLENVVLLDTFGTSVGSYAGTPYRYDIYGVAGKIALGDQLVGGAVDPADPMRYFHRTNDGTNLAEKVMSTTAVELLLNWGEPYPVRLGVTGARPGVYYGPVKMYGEHWVLPDRYAIDDVTVFFRLAGSSDYDFVNKNPFGYFYLVGEYHEVPPEPTGELFLDREWVLRGTSAPIDFSILRAGPANTVPPFTDWDTYTELVVDPGPIPIGVDPGTIYDPTSDGNNGHGNNLDFVDVTNEGQGIGGSTGLLNEGLDPSGTFDDEGAQGQGWKKKAR